MQDLTVGTIIDRKYRVVHPIGAGGMGVVVAADHLELRQRVAVKVLKVATEDEQLERFYREGRTLGQLKSEHVTRVYDVGALAGGEPYLVMELLQGQDLHAVRAERGALPVAEAIDYVLQACVGLAEAHLEGIVHRDIKPANLFLAHTKDHRQVVKVLDFGISKVNAEAQGAGTALTASGAMMGSPRFMSPEQLRSARDVDARADVWSLGVTLYELLAGRPAFEAPSVADLVMSILTEPAPPIRQLAPHVPEGVELALRRCMASDRDHRYDSVAQLAADLAPFVPPRGAYWLERIEALHRHKGQSMPAPTAAPPSFAQTAPTRQTIDPTVASSPVAAVTVAGAPATHDAPRAGSGAKVALAIGALLFLVVGGGAAAFLLTGDEGAERDRDRDEEAREDDDASNEKKRSSEHPRATKEVKKIPSTSTFIDEAPRLARLVKEAHGGAPRYYDVILFADKATFVIQSDDGLVAYEVDRKRFEGPDPFDLEHATRTDNLLLDHDRIPFDKPAALAKQAGAGVYSVSLQRDADGVGWQVAFEDGRLKRFDLNGRPR